MSSICWLQLYLLVALRFAAFVVETGKQTPSLETQAVKKNIAGCAACDSLCS